MLSGLRGRVLPASQRRTLQDLEQDLDLSSGDTRAKRSAFWAMLTLSSVIAACGVLTDSTATVIGAMIIAPLSTPIMGIALGSVQRRRNGSVRHVVLGCFLVIAMGIVFSLVLPSGYDLLSNSQISARTSPTLLDMVAAVATGLAGATALSRRDVAAVLPGVAIAISLVPPLVVAGVCFGQLAWSLALGALTLFLSNLVALVVAGVAVFAVLAYTAEDGGEYGRWPPRVRLALTVLFVAVTLPPDSQHRGHAADQHLDRPGQERGHAVALRPTGSIRHGCRRGVQDDLRPSPQSGGHPTGREPHVRPEREDPGRHPHRRRDDPRPAYRRRTCGRLSHVWRGGTGRPGVCATWPSVAPEPPGTPTRANIAYRPAGAALSR